VPCFMWIFVGAPYIEALRHLKILNAALASITAAVVGVIFNLSLWFAIHTLFEKVSPFDFGAIHLIVPDIATVRLPALVLTLAALIAMLRFHVNMLITLSSCAVLGLLWSRVG